MRKRWAPFESGAYPEASNRCAAPVEPTGGTRFHTLDKKDIRKIVDLQLEKLQQRMKDQELTLHVTDAAKTVLADEGYDPVYGARPLKRVIQQRLQNELANRLLAGDFNEGDTITIDVQNGDFTFAT